MSGFVTTVLKPIWLLDITHSRENRMPVQIAEVRATGYIPQQLKKNGSMMMGVKDSATSHNMKNISSQKDESSQKQLQAGETLRRWQRTDNEGHSYHRGGITNGE